MAARVGPEHCALCSAPASHLITYHYVVEGELHVRVEGEEAFVLGAGEVVLLPRNDPHLLGSDLELPPAASRDIIQPPKDGGLFSIHHGGRGARTRLVYGFLGCGIAEGNPVIASLPAALRVDVEQGGAAEWIHSTCQYAADAVAAGRPVARRSTRALCQPGPGAAAPRPGPRLDGRRAGPRGRAVPLGVG
jgi:hypothetical protein